MEPGLRHSTAPSELEQRSHLEALQCDKAAFDITLPHAGAPVGRSNGWSGRTSLTRFVTGAGGGFASSPVTCTAVPAAPATANNIVIVLPAEAAGYRCMMTMIRATNAVESRAQRR